MNIKVESITNIAKQAGKAVLYVAAAATAYKLNESMYVDNSYTTATYSDAVKAIMDSSMFGSDKRRAMEAVKPYKSSELYKSVIHVMNDNSMLGSDKVRMIENLFDK